MKKTNLIIVILFVCFACCNRPLTKQENTYNHVILRDTIVDTLLSNNQPIDLEIEEKSICFDTLKIVAGNCKLLYYPFGVFNNIDELLNSFPKENVTKKQRKINYIEIYLIQINSNTIEVLISEDYCGKNNIAINIINAEIKDSTIEIANCLKTGMTKQAFIKMLNLAKINNLNEIKVIELISIVDGVWQYYTFNESDVLVKIEIKSDYVFE